MSDRLDRYLAREAFDYLEQMDAALRVTGSPDAETLRRLSGGVRGSARMAGLEGVEAVAGRMEEALGRMVRDGGRWTGALGDLVGRTVVDLKRLVGAGERWSAVDDAAARAAISRWDAVGEGGDAAVVPIETLLREGGEAAEAGAVPADGEVVPIESLLLSPDRAVRMAMDLRAGLERSARDLPGGEAVRAGLQDLFELLEIAVRGQRPPG